MSTLTNYIALAYANHGRWIAECPRPFCGNAISLKPRQTRMRCNPDHGGCAMVAPVEWPAKVDEITQALKRRPVPSTRNWFPAGHPMAVKMNLPMDQTPAELVEEQRRYEEAGE